jgi:hypothetical protein
MQQYLFQCSILILAFMSQALTAVLAQDLPADWQIVAGERVGLITKTTSELMLESLYQASNIQRTDVELGEGFTEPGTTLFADDPTRRIEILWDNEDRLMPRAIRLTGASSVWHTSEGLSLGSTLKEIDSLNGFPFRLMGFGWDYGGTFVDCGRGRLTFLGCRDSADGQQRKARLITVRLGPVADARTKPEYLQVMGEKEFSSGHPAMQVLNPAIYQMIITFP